MTIDRSQTPWEIDPRPLVRAVVEDCIGRTPPQVIAQRFHAALCATTAEVVADAVATLAPRAVVLSGGCFANPVLAQGLRAHLATTSAAQVPLCLQRHVPPGDGGIALGQLVIADATVSRACSKPPQERLPCV
jgi:hydrogenase maturation protein HypF